MHVTNLAIDPSYWITDPDPVLFFGGLQEGIKNKFFSSVFLLVSYLKSVPITSVTFWYGSVRVTDADPNPTPAISSLLKDKMS
jgi:hypothetical protein